MTSTRALAGAWCARSVVASCAPPPVDPASSAPRAEQSAFGHDEGRGNLLGVRCG